MGTNTTHRTFVEDISASGPGEVLLRGWVYRLRILGKTSFIVLRDCSGTAQCVAATETLQNHRLKVEDVVEIRELSAKIRAQRPVLKSMSEKFRF